jgi:hypothetical protein
MKAFLIVILVILVVSLAVMGIACDQYAGMYICVDPPGSWLLLKGDGTFETILGIQGRWDVSDHQLTLTWALGIETYIIEDGKIMTQTGKVEYVKQ